MTRVVTVVIYKFRVTGTSFMQGRPKTESYFGHFAIDDRGDLWSD